MNSSLFHSQKPFSFSKNLNSATSLKLTVSGDEARSFWSCTTIICRIYHNYHIGGLIYASTFSTHCIFLLAHRVSAYGLCNRAAFLSAEMAITSDHLSYYLEHSGFDHNLFRDKIFP